MKRHKFPLLLLVVILTAVSITSFQQFRPLTATPQKPVTARVEGTVRQPGSRPGPRMDSTTAHQGIRSATARVDIDKVNNEKAEEVKVQDQGIVALSKADGTY